MAIQHNTIWCLRPVQATCGILNLDDRTNGQRMIRDHSTVLQGERDAKRKFRKIPVKKEENKNRQKNEEQEKEK